MARPLVLGEEPGLSADLADPWGMVLTFLWLLAAVGWAAWRFWLRPASQGSGVRGQGSEQATSASQGSGARGQGSEQATTSSALTPEPWPLTPEHWYGGLVQTALLATVALVFVSAEWAAAYKFPARLIAWEWFGLFVSFLVVRQLAVTPREQHGLFAVVLAGAVALSAQGIYQVYVELPQNRQLAEDLEAFRANWAEENPGQNINENFLEQLRLRAMENNIFGPYAHPNSYAGFLALWLPGLIGAVVVSRRMRDIARRSLGMRTVLTALCTLLGLSALWLTHSRGALLGLVVAGVGVGVFAYRQLLRAHIVALLLGMVVLIGLAYGGWRSGLLTSGIGKQGNPIAQRLEYWRTTWQMIGERPWLGVGPGNFGEIYPRFMPANSEEKIKDPHNFALEMWATCGVFALLTLLAALAAFFYHMVREWRGGDFSPPLPQEQEADDPPSPEEPVRWEFYLGGMVGLVLGFVLRVNTATPNTILAETYAAAVRSVVWFAAFALLERLAWTDRSRVLALTSGIVALLVNLCVSGGIGFPSVAGPLWVAIALALNAAALRPARWLSRAGAAMIVPLPIFIGIFLGYGVYILYPVLDSDRLVRDALQAVAYYQTEKNKPLAERSGGIRDHPDIFIKKGVIDRLNQARGLTPDDARIYVQLAWGTNIFWELSQRKSVRELPIAENAIRFGMKATQLDPRGAAGYLVQYQIRLIYAQINEASAEALRKSHGDPVVINEREYTAREQYKLAAKTLEDYLPNDPHDAALHHELWRAWSKAGDKEKGREHADKALHLDHLVTMPARKLTDSQRKQLDEWRKESKANTDSPPKP